MKGPAPSTKRSLSRPALTVAGVAAIVFGSVLYPPLAEGAGHPLDPYYGFGRSEAAATRDDAIALWEAYRRDVLVAECMASEGFEFKPEVAFPAEPILVTAEYLGSVVKPLPLDPDPEEWNAEYRAGLSAERLEDYYRTYLGESAEAVRLFEEDGETPAGSDPGTFARGGCVGQAAVEIGSIWDAYRELEEELEAMDADALASDAVAQARIDFRACMVSQTGHALDGPAETEELLSSIIDDGQPGSEDALMNGLDTCTEIWAAGYQAGDTEAAAAFIERNLPVLEDQQARYAHADETMRADTGFKEWLHAAAGAVAFEQVVSGDGSHPPEIDT